MSERLRRRITNILHGKDEEISKMSNDIRDKYPCRTMIEGLNLTEETFESTLERISNTYFSYPKKDGRTYYIPLLLFCIELNAFHTIHSSWYNTDMLVEALVTIFIKSNYTLSGSYNYYYTCIGFWVCLFLFVNIIII